MYAGEGEKSPSQHHTATYVSAQRTVKVRVVYGMREHQARCTFLQGVSIVGAREVVSAPYA